MKKVLALLLIFLIPIAGCGKKNGIELEFYYKSVSVTASDSTLIGSQSYFYSDAGNINAIADIYFSGPDSSELVSPFPKGTALESYQVSGHTMELQMNEAFAQLSGIDLSLAVSCICMTFSQLEAVDDFVISVPNGFADGSASVKLSADQITTDSAALSVLREKVDIYYPGESGRYLLSETRTVAENAVNIQEWAAAALCDAFAEQSETESLLNRNMIQEVAIDNNICYIDLSEAFYNNAPEDEVLQRTVLLAIVNTMTSFDSVNGVRFTCNNAFADSYGEEQLNFVWSFDSSRIGPVRTGMNEIDASLCILRSSGDSTVTVPVRLRSAANESNAEALINRLFSYGTLNGLFFPGLKQNSTVELNFSGTVCYVVFSEAMLDFENYDISVIEDCISQTLLSLEEIDRVVFAEY